MHKRFQRAYTSIKETTFVSYAKIATVGGFCDIDLILVKATSPEDIPLRDRYVLQLLKIFAVSPQAYRTFASSFSRRFTKTKCWRVALKCLILLHRLLRALPYNTQFRSGVLWTRTTGYLSLNPCTFRDTSSLHSQDYTLFISSYACLLDEALDCVAIASQYPLDQNENKEDDDEITIERFPDKMKRVGEMLEILPQLQTLIDRVIECKPKGSASRSFLVHSALKYIIRDSFSCYNNFRTEIISVLDHLIQLPYRSCMMAFRIYKKAAVQANELSEFYDWCKSVGLCGIYEYPFVDLIPEIQIQALETFLDGMWQLTESSCSSAASPITSTGESSSMDDEKVDENADENADEKADGKLIVRFNNWVQFEESGMKEESVDVVNWEVLLEASVILAPLLVSDDYFWFDQDGRNGRLLCDLDEGSGNDLKIQVYDPYVINPFYDFYQLDNSSGGFTAGNETAVL